ncbi:putative reverse transcriptase domain-containing protein [Tanacetum coccineum]
MGEDSREGLSDIEGKVVQCSVLTLPDGPNDFVVYCDASHQGFGCVLMQRGKVIAFNASRQVKNPREDLFTHDLGIGCGGIRGDGWNFLVTMSVEIKYHPEKQNVIADALSSKEKLKPRRVRAMKFGCPIWRYEEGFNYGRSFMLQDIQLLPGADKMYYDLRDVYWWPGPGSEKRYS